MISRHEAILNGVALSSVSPLIYITDISYPAPPIRTDLYTVAKRQGGRIRRRYIEKNSVVISMMIRAYDVRQRQEICNAVGKWAKNGGILETRDHVGQRLRCVCDNWPTVQSALRWTDPVTVTLSAYEQPFWEEIFPSKLTLTGTSASGVLNVPGNADDALIEAKITAGAALSSVTLTAGSKSMTLSGLSVASGGVITISYDDEMIQSIKYGTTSLLNKRTGADDLLAESGGKTTISISASASVTAEFSARGLWI